MKAIDEPPYLTVGTDVSAKYRGAFCEAKIKTAKRLVKVKVTFRHDSSTVEVQDDHIKGPLKVGAVVEVKNLDGAYQEAVINKLTDASWYTVVFDDGDEKTLRRSSLCLKGERHFAESETLDQLPLTNPEHFGTPVIGKKTNRGRRSNHIPEEESSSSSSDEDEDDRKQTDELLGKVVCVDYVSLDKKKALCFPALVVCPDCSDEIAVKKDNILVRSFKDGKFTSVPRKDVHEIISDTAPKPDAILKQAFDHALEFHKSRTIPANWKTELKEDSSSSEAEEEEEEDDEKEKEDNSSEEEEEIEPFPEERENFLQQLYKFMEDRGTPINKRPVLGYRNLNLFKLFRLVHKLGGFDNIESGAVWKQVYQDLGIPVLNSAAGYNVKCAYKKYLYGFEEYCRSANIEFQMALPEKVVNKPCKECENVKEIKVKEENEPEIKEIKIEEEEKKILKEEKPTEEDIERKEIIKPSLGSKKGLLDSIPTQTDHEKEGNIKKTQENENLDDKDDETTRVDESLSIKVEAEEEKAKSGYDEWIKADKIVRPADKNVPKIKHRKKIKNKLDKEKDKDEKYSPKNCKMRRLSKPPFQTNSSPEMVSKLDLTDAKNSDTAHIKSIEITSILNGLQASESSGEDSEQEDETDAHDMDNNGKEESKTDYLTHARNDLLLKEEQNSSSLLEENKVHADLVISKPASKSPERVRKDIEVLSEDTDYEEDDVTKKRKDVKKDTTDKSSKPQVKRGKRRHCNTEECSKTGSPSKRDEKTKNKESLCAENSSNSSSDEDEEEKSKAKLAPTKKYNGLEEKRKSLRTTGFYSGFSEVAEKRIKLLNNSDERLQNSRAKDRKDVWSSIQGQWPKKTLKELFSDSDTEAAASPPHPAPEEGPAEGTLQTVAEEESCSPSAELETPPPVRADSQPTEEKPMEVSDKKAEFPSSGSNSVLNTPPTTPESPSSVTVTEASQQQSCVSEVLAPNQEEVRSIKSETDSTIEVDSVAGELQDLQSEGNSSPAGCDASVSSSSSAQPEPEHPEKACTGQKRGKEAQGGGSSSKKQKRSHKATVVNNKKKGKGTNSSDSEELSGGESVTKTQSVKSISTGMKSHSTKSPARTQSPGKCGRNGDKDPDLKEPSNRLPKVYKWSFQMSDLENMTSAERITILQEKLQEIRKHYLSLKSEVASIDRRRKRLKKKESAATSSSSSSPSSSSITAAVMLTLAEPSMSSTSQNGMSVECR
ncbi:AT-rich interactive domain-containing protein 4B isoform X3 [Saccopteryx bilineata]|uniref:AT-rich interactive domain-containing protein 4B isoform X3 n=1 Tax=Saccopteryx bilineata TaxID=59482 RepID=UPI00338EFB08